MHINVSRAEIRCPQCRELESDCSCYADMAAAVACSVSP